MASAFVEYAQNQTNDRYVLSNEKYRCRRILFDKHEHLQTHLNHNEECGLIHGPSRLSMALIRHQTRLPLHDLPSTCFFTPFYTKLVNKSFCHIVNTIWRCSVTCSIGTSLFSWRKAKRCTCDR